MVQSRSAGPEDFRDRRALSGPGRQKQAVTTYTQREAAPAGPARQRPPRPERTSPDEPKWDISHSERTSKLARGVLLGGMLLAIVGVVQVAWMPEKRALTPSVAQEALARQIDQLRTELDEERSEKSELLEKIASAEALAESASVKLSSDTAEPVVRETAAVPAAVAPASAPVPDAVEPTAAKLAVPSDRIPAAGPDDLPQPMAPSAELLLTEIPVEDGGTAADSAAYGIHLASFADRTMAERGWALLQRNHPTALGVLKPRVDEAKDEKGKPVFLLIAGPFDTEALAAAHCRKIHTQVVFCKPRPFSGREFASAGMP